jgi:hypothetical protein
MFGLCVIDAIRRNPQQERKLRQGTSKPISESRSKKGLIETKKHEKHGLKTFGIPTYVDYESRNFALWRVALSAYNNIG